MARPEGLEPPAYWFEASRSIHLSYGRARIPLYRGGGGGPRGPSQAGQAARLRVFST